MSLLLRRSKRKRKLKRAVVFKKFLLENPRKKRRNKKHLRRNQKIKKHNSEMKSQKRSKRKN